MSRTKEKEQNTVSFKWLMKFTTNTKNNLIKNIKICLVISTLSIAKNHRKKVQFD